MAEALPVFRGVLEIAPPAAFRVAGQKIPRQAHRYSGRTALHADADVREPTPPGDPDSPLAFSMEGYLGQPPSALIAHDWAPGWNSVQALNKSQIEVGGPLRGGDPGRRLIEPSAALGPGPAPTEQPPYYRDVPRPFARRDGEWLAIPVEHVFGTEELSIHSPGVAELAPKPCLGLSPDDAKALGAKEGGEVELSLPAVAYALPVRLRPALPRGVAELPLGLPGLAWADLPAWGRLRAAAPAQETTP